MLSSEPTSSLSWTGSPWSRKRRETNIPCAWRGGSGSSGGRSSSPPSSCSAAARETTGPLSAPSGRCGARGSRSTRSTVTPPRWRKRRIAPRDCGTANAAASATSRTASASTSPRRHGTPRRDGSAAATRGASRGVSGQATSAPSRRSSVSRLIRLPEPGERARGARLDRAVPHSQGRGRLVLREVEEVAARQDEASLLGQLLELLEQPPPLVGADRGFLGRGGRLARGSRDPQRQMLASARRPPAVARLVRHDPEQPGAQRRVGAEAAERPPGLEEPLLGGVLGVGGVAGDDVGHSECDLLVGADERLVGARVAALRAQDELPLLAWTALHTRYYTAVWRGVPAASRLLRDAAVCRFCAESSTFRSRMLFGVTSTHSSSRISSSACSSESGRGGIRRTVSSELAARMFVSFFSLVAFTSRSLARAFSPTIMPS